MFGSFEDGPRRVRVCVCERLRLCVWVWVCLCLPLSDINYTLETLRTCDLEDGNNNDCVGIGKRFIHISIAFHFNRLTANTTNPLYIREHAAAVHHQGAQRRFGTEFEPRPLGPISMGQRSAGGVERPSGRYLHWRHIAAAQRHRRPWHADQRAGHKTAWALANWRRPCDHDDVATAAEQPLANGWPHGGGACCGKLTAAAGRSRALRGRRMWDKVLTFLLHQHQLWLLRNGFGPNPKRVKPQVDPARPATHCWLAKLAELVALISFVD